MNDILQKQLYMVGYEFVCENPELDFIQLARKAEDLADAHCSAHSDDEIEEIVWIIFEGMLAARKTE